MPLLASDLLRKAALAAARPLTPETDDTDEGYDDDDFPEQFPFWYNAPSGVQKMSDEKGGIDAKRQKRRKGGSIDDLRPPTPPSPKLNRRASYLDHDSVLQYFVASGDEETKLDRYLTGIIDAFLTEPSPVYATQPDTPESLKAKFNNAQVPLRRKSVGKSGTSAEDYLKAVKANVVDRATRVSSPKMIGHMTTALPYFHRPLARLLAALNQNVVKLETASTMTYLERETVAMLHREFYKECPAFYQKYIHSPEHSLGVFCSGGTIANITAMWAARNRALPADNETDAGFRGVDKEGLYKALSYYGYKGAVIVGSRLMHYSFKKAADLLGLGDDGLITIDADDQFRMRVDELETRLAELKAANILVVAVVGIAGTTETGSIDPLERIASVCASNKIHFHVDAAWGGPLIFSTEHCRKLSGIQYADTITIDGHKQLYTPMGLGLVLYKAPTTAQAIRKTANYIIRHDSLDLGKFTLEGSRPATSLHLHASLNLLGRDGLECLVTRSATLARQMSVRVGTHPTGAFQALHTPETNIFLCRYIPTSLREKVHEGDEPLTDTEDEFVAECTRRVQTTLAAVGTPSAAGLEAAARSSDDTSPTDPHLEPHTTSLPLPAQEFTGFVSRTRVRFQNRDVDAFRIVIANPLTSWDDVEDVVRHMVIIGERVEKDVWRERFMGVLGAADEVTAAVDGAGGVPAPVQVVRKRSSMTILPDRPKVERNSGEDERWKTLKVPDVGEKPWVGWPYDI